MVTQKSILRCILVQTHNAASGIYLFVEADTHVMHYLHVDGAEPHQQ